VRCNDKENMMTGFKQHGWPFAVTDIIFADIRAL
jgi:hypothetical protein